MSHLPKIITEHAVVRYMERKYGADFSIVREEMMTPGLRAAIDNGAAKYVHDGFEFVIAGKRVVTVKPVKAPK